MKTTTQRIGELQNEIQELKKTPNAAQDANKELGQLVEEINQKIALARSIADTWNFSFDLTIDKDRSPMHYSYSSDYGERGAFWSDDYWNESSRYC